MSLMEKFYVALIMVKSLLSMSMDLIKKFILQLIVTVRLGVYILFKRKELS